MAWEEAQEHELDFWLIGATSCTNTFTEENKQLNIYAPRMKFAVDEWHRVDFEGKSVIDIGAGPVSLLLKGKNLKKAYAVDPLMDRFPYWVKDRYETAGINFMAEKGEELKLPRVDMVIIYNVLQHVENPEKLVENAKSLADEIRIFEWVNVSKDDKHIHTLTSGKLNEWFGAKGITEHVTAENSFTDAWYATIK